MGMGLFSTRLAPQVESLGQVLEVPLHGNHIEVENLRMPYKGV